MNTNSMNNTMGSPEQALTRRTALLSILGAGSVAALTACGSSTAGSQSSETANKDLDNHDYSGEVKFDSYETPAGEYKPATRTERAQNVPKPTMPQNMGDKTIAGLYSTIGYYMAALKYMGETMDFEPLGVVTDGGNDQFSAMAQQFKDKMFWYGNLQVTTTLKTPQPTKDGDTYSWPATIVIDVGDFMVYNGKVRELTTEKDKRHEQNEDIKATYEDGQWHISTGTSSSRGTGGMSGTSST